MNWLKKLVRKSIAEIEETPLKGLGNLFTVIAGIGAFVWAVANFLFSHPALILILGPAMNCLALAVTVRDVEKSVAKGEVPPVRSLRYMLTGMATMIVLMIVVVMNMTEEMRKFSEAELAHSVQAIAQTTADAMKGGPLTPPKPAPVRSDVRGLIESVMFAAFFGLLTWGSWTLGDFLYALRIMAGQRLQASTLPHQPLSDKPPLLESPRST